MASRRELSLIVSYKNQYSNSFNPIKFYSSLMSATLKGKQSRASVAITLSCHTTVWP